jgi:hypothetical protein
MATLAFVMVFALLTLQKEIADFVPDPPWSLAERDLLSGLILYSWRYR